MPATAKLVVLWVVTCPLIIRLEWDELVTSASKRKSRPMALMTCKNHCFRSLQTLKAAVALTVTFEKF